MTTATTTANLPRLLSRRAAADVLGVKVSTLAAWCCRGDFTLPVIRVGRRTMYALADIERFITKQTCRSAADDTEQG